jgi:two-component system response regulator HydG
VGKQQKLNGSEADRLRVLIIDDDANHAQTIAEVLERVGHHCQIAVNGNAGIKRIEREEYDVILTDLRMADVDGLTIVRKARATQPDAEVFVITGFGEVKTAVQAIQDGAAQYLLKPLGHDRTAGHFGEDRPTHSTGPRQPRIASATR